MLNSSPKLLKVFPSRVKIMCWTLDLLRLSDSLNTLGTSICCVCLTIKSVLNKVLPEQFFYFTFTFLLVLQFRISTKILPQSLDRTSAQKIDQSSTSKPGLKIYFKISTKLSITHSSVLTKTLFNMKELLSWHLQRPGSHRIFNNTRESVSYGVSVLVTRVDNLDLDPIKSFITFEKETS